MEAHLKMEIDKQIKDAISGAQKTVNLNQFRVEVARLIRDKAIQHDVDEYGFLQCLANFTGTSIAITARDGNEACAMIGKFLEITTDTINKQTKGKIHLQFGARREDL